MNLNLNIFNTTTLFEAATNLFEQLGIKLNSNTAEALPTKDLLNSFYKDNKVFNSIRSTYFIGIIDDSVFQATGMPARSAGGFDVNYSIKEALQQGDKNYEGLMFFALELTKKPTRTEISEVTRAFNRISQKMPVALVLKYPPTSLLETNEALISIAISERFKYLQNWRQGEKAGKVIILRDIFTSNTHAGHQHILSDLVKPAGVTNYAQLHAQWLEVLDVNILNKKFFQELANWYFWAMDKVQFPDDIEKKKEVRNATNLIRLITRVIFIWFIKEKHLVPDSLFNEKYLSTILKDFHKNEKSSNYYQAILQNLFFGTLNQKMDERDFAEDHNRTNKLDQGIKNKYRYPDKFNIAKKEVIDLFKDIPFLNGGLFDCLDKFDEEKLEKGKKEQIFVDGFTRLDGKQAIVPDYLFFGVYPDVDLTEYYDPEAKKPIVKNVKGLIDILNNFKFTVAENTPIEEEIALDPELLGKVFENLLASYNPETKTTARKQTGSFYTPREIVNYMVDESLIEYLKSVVSISAHEKQNNLSISAVAGEDGKSVQETLSRDAQWTFFNPNNEIDIHQGNYPHWQQKDVWYFITFRLGDSIPAKVVEKIKLERELWLKKHPDFKNLTKEDRIEYYRLFSERVETLLNAGKGSCVLKDQKVAKIVSDALLHFNNERYILDEWVIMPNHVHILVKPLEGYTLPEITHSWKSFTANEINKVTGNKGQLWMHESYDHIVRNEKALQAIRNYIRQNPVKAKLTVGEYLLSESKDASGTLSESKDASGTLTGSKDASGTLDTRLRNLFSYDEEGKPFNPEEIDQLIEAINNCKILDPACGSGAFPMGVLHKMVHLLQKLDPGNVKWKAQQKEKIIGNQIRELEKDKKAIEGLSDKAVREKAIQAVDERLKEIDEIFESQNNLDDYARKLYLIENCIYGIDIQPIAVQISKLRFFISLIIDQDKDSKKDNLGIRPLPNLETKFVAANTLISLEIPTTDLFSENNPIKLLQEQLKATRHEYFNAKTRNDKLNLQKQDKELRKKIAAQISDTLINKKEEEIANLEKQLSEAKKKLAQIEAEPEQKETIETTNLFGDTETTVIDKKKEKIKAQKSTISLIEKQINALKATDNKDAIQKVAQQISSFDPYDQNHYANWFEPEWMFGNEVNGGFDILIGNPPYGIVKSTNTEKHILTNYQAYYTADFKVNLYALFIEKSINLSKDGSINSFIIPDSSLNLPAFKKLREYILKTTQLAFIAHYNEDVFESAAVGKSVILSYMKGIKGESFLFRSFKNSFEFEENLIENSKVIKDNDLKFVYKTNESGIDYLLDKLKAIKTKLSDFCEVYDGINPGSEEIKGTLITEKKIDSYSKKIIDGKCFYKYTPIEWDGYYIYYSVEFVEKLRRKIESKGGTFTARIIKKTNFFTQPKIVTRQTADTIIGTVDLNKYYVKNSVHSTILKKEFSNSITLYYVLGILNSKLIEWFYKTESLESGRLFPQVKIERLRNLPFVIWKDKSIINQVQDFVIKIIETKKSNLEIDTSKLEKQIDELVYKLYELTEEEIAIIENSLKKD